MNPINIIKQYMLQGLTPKGILSKMSINNPILNNVITMAQNGNTKGVEDFAERCIIGTYLITMPNHITTVIDGIVYDTFDCRDRELWDVWKVE